MAKKFTDLSQLTKSILKKNEPEKSVAPISRQTPIPHPTKPLPNKEEEKSNLTRDEEACLAYFSHTSLTDSRFATAGRVQTAAERKHASETKSLPELKTEVESSEEMAKLRQALAEAEERERAKELELADQRTRLAASEARNASLVDEIRSLRMRCAEHQQEAVPLATIPQPPPVSRTEKKSILNMPLGFEEMFPGEVREMVIAALDEARQTAESANRERRSAVYSALLAANPFSGELERRRAALKQILRDANNCNRESTLKRLDKLGVKVISGRKHWKLEYANVRTPIAKTPSDNRANLNSAADLAKLYF